MVGRVRGSGKRVALLLELSHTAGEISGQRVDAVEELVHEGVEQLGLQLSGTEDLLGGRQILIKITVRELVELCQ